MDVRVLFYMIDGAFILGSLFAVLWIGSEIWRDRGRRRTEARLHEELQKNARGNEEIRSRWLRQGSMAKWKRDHPTNGASSRRATGTSGDVKNG